jgi:ferredoxin-NADP reductase
VAVALNETAPQGALLSAQVIARAPAARDAVTFWLAAPGTQRAPAPYLPGQFITLFLPTTARGTISRSYSLCGDGRPDRPWEITVQRQHGGTVSTYLLDRIESGMVLQVSPPAGTFILPRPLRSEVPLMMVATGSGITPLYGMLRAIALLPQPQRPRVHLYYAYRSLEESIYGRELVALDPQRTWLHQYHYVSSRSQRLSGDGVVAHAGAAAPYAHWYICGSAGLKRSMEALLVHRGVPAAQVHVELFASPRTAPTSTAMSAATTGHEAAAPVARIRLADDGAVLEARGQETLLEALEHSGYRVPFSCRTGACGTCRLRLLSGHVADGGASGLTPTERAQGYILSCVARPRGEVVIADTGARLATAGRLSAVGAEMPQADRWRGGRRVIRWTMVAAALAIFAGTWHLTSGSTTQAAGTSPGSSSAPAQLTPTPSGDDGNNGDNGGISTPLPSGSGGINVGPSQPTPVTSSGTS